MTFRACEAVSYVKNTHIKAHRLDQTHWVIKKKKHRTKRDRDAFSELFFSLPLPERHLGVAPALLRRAEEEREHDEHMLIQNCSTNINLSRRHNMKEISEHSAL